MLRDDEMIEIGPWIKTSSLLEIEDGVVRLTRFAVYQHPSGRVSLMRQRREEKPVGKVNVGPWVYGKL